MFVLYVDGIDMSFKEGDMAKKIMGNQIPTPLLTYRVGFPKLLNLECILTTFLAVNIRG